MRDLDLALVRFVTARQAQLRGLREVAFATGACATMSAILWLSDLRPRSAGILIVLLFWILWTEGVVRCVNWRYDSKYGRVAVGANVYRRGPTSVGQTLLAIGAGLDIYLPASPLAGHSAFPMLVALYAVWIVSRDFPWRSYYVAAVVVALVAPRVDDPSRMMSYFPAYAAGLASIAVTGLLDHILLMVAFARLKRNGQTVQVSNRTSRSRHV